MHGTRGETIRGHAWHLHCPELSAHAQHVWGAVKHGCQRFSGVVPRLHIAGGATLQLIGFRNFCEVYGNKITEAETEMTRQHQQRPGRCAHSPYSAARSRCTLRAWTPPLSTCSEQHFELAAAPKAQRAKLCVACATAAADLGLQLAPV